MKVKQILEKYKNSTDHYTDQDYSEDSILQAMVEYARLKCKEQRIICAEAADQKPFGCIKVIDKETIIYANEPDFN